MKLMNFGDLHTKNTTPINRTDDYYDTQFKKLDYGLKTGHKKGARHVLLPGDVFDNYGRDPYSLIYDFADVITRYGQKIYAVMGQHDVKYHRTDLTETPFHLLCKAGVITLLGREPHVIGKGVHLYGSSWGEEIPEVKDKNAINIIVAHRMVIKSKKLWPNQEHFVYGKTLLDTHNDFDLFVIGDNHNSFRVSSDTATLLNCGSLLRMRSDQKNHKPCFYIYSTKHKKATKYEIPIEPYENVFDLDRIKNTKNKKKFKDSGRFAASLRKNIKNGLSFDAAMKQCVKSHTLDSRVRYYIEKSYFGVDQNDQKDI